MARIFSAIAAVSVCGLFLCLAAPQPPASSAQQAPEGAKATPEAAEPQPEGPDQIPTIFTVDSDEVIVPVTVTDEKGRFVSNLDVSDFRVLDEGRPQRIKFFGRAAEKQPIVIGFLVEASNGTRIQWKNFQGAIKELIWTLLPGDKTYTGYLISYSTEAELLMNTTWDGDKMAEKVDRMKPGGGSALFDAIYMAITRRDLVQGEPYTPRRVMVIIGDGNDNASKKRFEEVLELAQRNMVTIYGVSTVAYGFTKAEQATLERLAQATGGKVEYPMNRLYRDVSGYLSTPRDEGNYVYQPGSGGYASAVAKGIIEAVANLRGELTTQYVLRYIPDVDPLERPKLTRRIKVELPELPNAKVSAREYYYPMPVPGAPGRPAITAPTISQ